MPSSGPLLGAPLDIWACGVVYYALLTGNLPFTAHTERDLLKKITLGIYHQPPYLTTESKNLLSVLLSVDPLRRQLPPI